MISDGENRNIDTDKFINTIKKIIAIIIRVSFLIFGIYCAYLLFLTEGKPTTIASCVACGVFSVGLGFIFGIIFCGVFQMIWAYITNGLFSNNDD